MKKLIGIFLIYITFTSCIGTRMLRCKVEGNINDKIIIYPVKQENHKRIKNFEVVSIEVREKLDSTTWEKVWVDVGPIKPINGIILYGQKNEDKKQPFLPAKELKKETIYEINFSLNSYSNGYGICGCKFNVDKDGNAAQVR